jgi:shikimate dehydrogenase
MISPRTEVFCVIGNPVSHSLSPLMHNAAFKASGYDGVYIGFEVTDVAAAVEGMRAFGIRGVSVTIPHKVSVMAHLDDIDETARKIGAVNTIVNQDGRLMGSNTDSDGAVAALKEKTEISEKSVLISGAGGAARAIGFGVAGSGGHVCFCNRTEEKAKRLARELQSSFCPLKDIENEAWDILINTTSVGMTPKTENMPIPESLLKPGRLVMDIVYNPLKTLLLAKAEERGCDTVDGVAMFIHQGVCQFERWTGRKAPVDVMEITVRKALAA